MTTLEAKALNPLGLKGWVVKLGKDPLPILPFNAEAIRKALALEDVSLNKVAAMASQDPIFCLHLIRQANRLLSQRREADIRDIRHCIAMLGVGHVRQISRQLPVLSSDVNQAEYYEYLSGVMRSLHAAAHAKSWSQRRHHPAPQEIYLAALLFNVPNWCLWRFATREMELIEHLVTKERIPKPEAEKAVLGCTTEQLAVALAKAWKFPFIVRQALDPKMQPNPRFILRAARDMTDHVIPELPPYDDKGRPTNSASMMVLLANWLATETDIDWYSRQTERAVAVVSAFLHQSPQKTWHDVTHTSLSLSRLYPIPGVLKPAERLLWPADRPIRRRIKMSQLLQATHDLSDHWEEMRASDFPSVVDFMQAKHTKQHSETAEKVTGSNATPVAAQHVEQTNEVDLAMINNFLNQVKQNPKRFKNLIELMNLACSVLSRGTHLQRVFAATLDERGNGIQLLTGQGLDDSPELRHLYIKLQPANLFTKLMRQPAGLRVNPQHNAFAYLPEEFKQLIEVEEFFVASFFRGKEPVGILYADAGLHPSHTLQDNHYKAFQLVVQGINTCLGK